MHQNGPFQCYIIIYYGIGVLLLTHKHVSSILLLYQVEVEIILPT